jgi:hypothetical protein
VQKKFQKLDETEMETKKKKKTSKSRHNKDTAGNSLFQSELYQAGVNASLNERVAKSKEADSPSATVVKTQNFAETEVCTLVDKSVVLKRKSKTKKLRSEAENHELACEGMQNMKKYRNKASETSTKRRKGNKWKGISSEDTTHMEHTLVMDTAHQEHLGHDSKMKKKKRKALESENSA